MKFAPKAVAIGLSLLFSIETFATELKHWPELSIMEVKGQKREGQKKNGITVIEAIKAAHGVLLVYIADTGTHKSRKPRK